MSPTRKQRHLNTPAVIVLGLDQRTLMREVAQRYVKRFISRSARVANQEKAWESFGKPGRNPTKAKNVFLQMAAQNNWVPHLKVADLATQWGKIVGTTIAAHTKIVAFENGELVIQATSTVWSTQLTYMVPRLKKVISERLKPVEVSKITVKGPNSYSFKRGRYSVPGRGPRDTWG